MYPLSQIYIICVELTSFVECGSSGGASEQSTSVKTNYDRKVIIEMNHTSLSSIDVRICSTS